MVLRIVIAFTLNLTKVLAIDPPQVYYALRNYPQNTGQAD